MRRKIKGLVTRSRFVRGVFLALVGGIGWAFSGTCAEFLFEEYGIDPAWLTSVRMFISGICFIVMAFFIDRKHLLGALRSKRALLGFFIFGLFGQMFCQLTYLVAISYTDSGTATVLSMIGLALIMLYNARVSHRMPRKREMTGLALTLAGVFLIATQGDVTRLAMPLAGLIWGLASAVGLACYNLIPTRLIGRWGSIVTTGMGMLLGGGFMCIIEQPWTAQVPLEPGLIIGIAATIVVGTLIAGWAYVQAISDIGPVKSSLIAAVEPVAATIFTAVWLGTYFPAIDLLGFAFIVIMVLLVSSKSSSKEDGVVDDDEVSDSSDDDGSDDGEEELGEGFLDDDFSSGKNSELCDEGASGTSASASGALR